VNVGLAYDDLLGKGITDEEMAPSARVAQPKFPTADADSGPMGPVSVSDQIEPTPEQLAERSKAGCLDSFELLVLRYEGHIFNFLRQFTGNFHDAEDLTQETFVKAFRNLPRYNSSLLFAPWLFTIARRTGASHFRSADHFEDLPAAEESVQETPATALECKDERNSIWRLVRTLKPKQAQALWLRYAEGFSIVETARIMGTNQIHIKVLLHRARSNLLKMMIARGLGSANLKDLPSDPSAKRPNS
jgi:RNA polymerase sigma-70 factor (ECF subfamily)